MFGAKALWATLGSDSDMIPRTLFAPPQVSGRTDRTGPEAGDSIGASGSGLTGNEPKEKSSNIFNYHLPTLYSAFLSHPSKQENLQLKS